VSSTSTTRTGRATVRPAEGPEQQLPYDAIVITAGAVTSTFPTLGIADDAIGLKHVEEAVAIRDRLLIAFEGELCCHPARCGAGC
jgi:NADH dehydrogenase FAD-containing subunit